MVVPPISDTSASIAPVSQRAPTMLAAGPERIVSIGRSRAIAAEISAPSPRTTIRGASMPMLAKWRALAATNRSIRPIRRAFRTAVRARFGPFKFADNSWLQVTGRPVTRRIRSRAAISCAGLRVAKCEATAKPITASPISATCACSAAISNAAFSLPVWLCPPSNRMTGSPFRASVKPPRSRSPASNPMNTNATRPPWPSTKAFVASVVDNDTNATSPAATPASISAASTARPMPNAKSSRVVSDFAVPMTRSVASSNITASV